MSSFDMSEKKVRRKRRTINNIDYRMLDELACIQCSTTEIISIMDIRWETFTRIIKRDHNCTFTEYVNNSAKQGGAMIRRRQYEAAIEDKNITMLIWLGKNVLGQADKIESKEEVNTTISAIQFSLPGDDIVNDNIKTVDDSNIVKLDS